MQLFNAVGSQQRSLKTQLKEAGKSTRKRENVYKNIDKEGFLDVLSGGKAGGARRQQPVEKRPKKEAVKEEEEDGGWNILREDFMMGAKMKDWDKESDGEN